MRIVRLVDQWTEPTSVSPVEVRVEVLEDTETGFLLAGRTAHLLAADRPRRYRPLS